MDLKLYLYYIFWSLNYAYSQNIEDKPCAAVKMKESVICVCNETYCDEVVNVAPTENTYVTYTSSKAGARFKKEIHTFQTKFSDITNYTAILKLFPEKQFQTIQGFGGAATDSAGINWKKLTPGLQDTLVKAYFGDNGIRYSFIRVPIGSSDFSKSPYTYNDFPINDVKLSNFSLAFEDINYKIPLIKASQSISSAKVKIVGTTWSPPLWMKTNNSFIGESQLLEEYYQPYADYHLKFIEEYDKQGVQVWGVTTTNEPANGLINSPINSLGWFGSELGKYIEQNLGPTIRNSKYKNTKIITGDDQRYSIPYYFGQAIYSHPGALKYIDGIGVHFYGSTKMDIGYLQKVADSYPQIFILGTEACSGAFLEDRPKVDLGSWKRAEAYMDNIIEDLNNHVVGWIEWNLCLDSEGGPTWVSNFVDAPIIVRNSNTFVKQPIFFAMGHFAKFIPEGSVRIQVKDLMDSLLPNVAFLTPQNTIVVVVYNDSGKPKTVMLDLPNGLVDFKLKCKSFMTIELPYIA